MLDHGFATKSLARITLETPPDPIPVALGTSPFATVTLGEGSALLVEKGKASALSQTLELPASLSAPVEQGQQLGTLVVSDGGTVLAKIPLLAEEAVPKLTYGQLVLRLFSRTFGTIDKTLS